MFLIILFYIPFVNGLRSTFVFYSCCILPCLIGYFASNSLAFCSLIKSCCSGDLSQISSATFCNSEMGISLSIHTFKYAILASNANTLPFCF